MEKREKNFEEFTRVEPLGNDLSFYQSNKDRNNSELLLSHPNFKNIGYLVSDVKGEIKTNSLLSYKTIKSDEFNPYKLDEELITQGVDVFVLGCKGELKGILSFEGDGGYDQVYSIHNCAGIWFNPVRWY